MTPFMAELVGTSLLILLGDGVVANVVLGQTKGQGGGWIVITWGWAIGVFVGVLTVGQFSGAHLNPAVTIGLATAGKFPWEKAPMYIAAQFLGAALGATLVWAHYRLHFALTKDQDAKLAVFCTGPAIHQRFDNLRCEVIGTMVLVLCVLYMAAPDVGLGAINALPVALVVLGIGLSLGGTTGYAINPARDLAPRLMHALLPIPDKRDSAWGYAWVPVVGPCLGALLAAGIYLVGAKLSGI